MQLAAHGTVTVVDIGNRAVDTVAHAPAQAAPLKSHGIFLPVRTSAQHSSGAGTERIAGNSPIGYKVYTLHHLCEFRLTSTITHTHNCTELPCVQTSPISAHLLQRSPVHLRGTDAALSRRDAVSSAAGQPAWPDRQRAIRHGAGLFLRLLPNRHAGSGRRRTVVVTRAPR